MIPAAGARAPRPEPELARADARRVAQALAARPHARQKFARSPACAHCGAHLLPGMQLAHVVFQGHCKP